VTSRFSDEWYDSRLPRTRAELRRAGASRRAIAGPCYQRTARGCYRAVDVPGAPLTPTQRILDAVPLVPDAGMIAGWAAAYVLSVSVLDGFDHLTLRPLPVPILLPPGKRRRETAAITYRQSSRPAKATVVDDVRSPLAGGPSGTSP